jgi:hypothetical protein
MIKKIHYVPFLELLLFAVALVLLVFAFVLKFNLWLILVFLPVAYILTLGNAYFIKLKNDELIFFPLSPFLDAHSINVNSIMKINSEESYTLESDVTAESTFPVFKRKYRLEYFDKKGMKRTVLFSIHSMAKARRIFEAIKSKGFTNK